MGGGVGSGGVQGSIGGEVGKDENGVLEGGVVLSDHDGWNSLVASNLRLGSFLLVSRDISVRSTHIPCR
ncbi:hypothetical protein Tco_1466342 [Tanacetum coccineum]|uniref:Uncharacterized protein n=1 Tax=Tanacetum coccineum TaxID=301880 RepID=A0ABQ5CXT6_9ASTR